MDEPTQTLPAYPLSVVYFYLVEGCNLACRHCWLAPKYDPKLERTPVMPVEVFEQVIREGKPLGLNSVKLTGGEPLIHPQIDRLLDLIQQQGLSLVIETNGLACTPALAAKIAAIPDRFVSVSLDGADAKMHEWVRGVKGSFNAAIEGIQNLVNSDTPPQIIFSVMRENSSQIEGIIHLAEKLGAISIKFNVIQPTARGEALHESDAVLSVEEYIRIGRHIENDLAPTTKVNLFFDYPMAFRSLKRLYDGSGAGVCGIKSILGVIATGYYALCGIGEHIPEFVFGKVGVDSLAEVWNHNPVLVSLREGLPTRLDGICSNCLMQFQCLGACIAQNMYRSRYLWAPFWFCEEANKAGLFPASRIKIAA